MEEQLREFIEKYNVKIVTAKSHDRTPDHVVKTRIEKSNNGIVIIDYLSLIKPNNE